MKTILSLAVVLLLLPFKGAAQSGCYEKIREDGIRLLRQKKYGEAINQFWTALATCTDTPKNNDLDKLIQEAQNTWVKELQSIADREKKSADSERDARRRAEDSEKVAEQKKREAVAEGRRAELLRLSLLSENLRQKGRVSDAIWAAFLSTRLENLSRELEETTSAAFRPFAEAVRDSFSSNLFESMSTIGAVEWMKDGNRLLVQNSPFAIHLLDLQTNQNALITGEQGAALNWAISGSGKYLLTWTEDGKAQLLDGFGNRIATLTGHTEPIRTACFSDDDQWVVTGSRDNTARLWRTSDGSPAATLNGHTGNIYEVLFFPDNKRILTRSADGSVMTWDLAGNRLGVPVSNKNYIHDCAIDRDGLIVTGTASGELIFSNDKETLKTLSMPQEAGVPLRSIDLMYPVGTTALTLFGGKLVWGSMDSSSLSLLPQAASVAGIKVSGDGQKLVSWTAAGVEPGLVRIWPRNLLNYIDLPLPRNAAVAGVNWSPDNRYLLITLSDGSVYLTDRRGAILTVWEGHLPAGRNATPAVFSPDGNHIITVGPEGNALFRSPLPTVMYQKMLQEHGPNSDMLNFMAAKFGVRYFDSY